MLSIKTFRDDCRHLRLDANETVFFARQLEYVKARTYDVLYAELSAFRLFPISGEAGPGAKTITYRTFDSVGQAKIIAGYGRDLPRVDAKGKETSSNVRSIGASYGWSLQDIRAAMMAGVNLDAKKAAAAVRAHNQIINSIAWFGDAEYDLPGLKSNTDIPSAGATTGDWLSGATTADEIIADVNKLITDVIATTKGVEMVNTVAMPPAQLAALGAKPRSTNSDTTVLAFLRANWPGVEFTSAVELEDWSGSDDAAIAFRRDDTKLTLEMPQPYEELPVQQVGLEFEVPTHSRCGGLIVYYPKSLNIITGV